MKEENLRCMYACMHAGMYACNREREREIERERERERKERKERKERERGRREMDSDRCMDIQMSRQIDM